MNTSSHAVVHFFPVIDSLLIQESLAVYKDYLFVGTKVGALIIYRVIKDRDRYTSEIVKTLKELSNKALTELCLIPHANVLFVLSAGNVTGYNLQDAIDPNKGVEQIGKIQLQGSRGTLLMHFNKARLCLGMKKKILIYHWNGKGFGQPQEVLVPDSVRGMCWIKNRLFVGFRREYDLYYQNMKQSKKVIETGKSGTPVMCKISNTEILLEQDAYSRIHDTNGDTSRKWMIVWKGVPNSMLYLNPNVIALLPSKVAIRNLQTQNLIQEYNVKGAKIIISNAKKDQIYIATDKEIFKLEPVPLLYQIDNLKTQHQYREALQLCPLLRDVINDEESVQKKTNEIKEAFGFWLFSIKEFDNAQNMLIESKSDPRKFLEFFKELVPKKYKYNVLTPDIEKPELTEEEKKKAIQSLIDFLSVTKTLQSTQELIKKDPQLAELIDTVLLKCYIRTDRNFIKGFLIIPTNKCDLEEAIQDLTQQNYRRELVELYRAKGMHSEGLTLLEALCKETNDPKPLIEYLSILPGKEIDLILKHSEWAVNTDPINGIKIFTNTADPRSKQETRTIPIQIVAEFLHHRNLAMYITFLEYVVSDYLIKEQTKLKNLELQKKEQKLKESKRRRRQRRRQRRKKKNKDQYSDEDYDEDSDDDYNSEDESDEDYDEDSDENYEDSEEEYSDSDEDDDDNDDNSSNNNNDDDDDDDDDDDLVDYQEIEKEDEIDENTKKNKEKGKKKKRKKDRMMIWESTMEKFSSNLLLAYLEQIKAYKKKLTNEQGKRKIEDLETKIDNIKIKMRRFIEINNYFNIEIMLTTFPEDDLYEERVMFLRKSGNHQKALDIIINKLSNFKQAINYCIQTYKDNNSKESEVYLDLLKLLLDTGNEKNQISKEQFIKRKNQAILVCKKFSKNIDIKRAIQLFPDQTSLKDLRKIMDSVFNTLVERRKNATILKSIGQSHLLNLDTELAMIKTKHKKITKETICNVCTKRIGNRIFALYPNGVICHVGCFENPYICPSTGIVFGEDPNTKTKRNK
ncbi:cnh domain containing [Anaeramoeba flamelloides]|uniref:Cnh domain containing n=1 Tax=Anaeramoeba flamelloides TaxID=1746091 RepID=A0AAV7YPC8_9EUKA|nr:cnh domain containing [Anaeramoeba flamelloides]